MFSLSDPYSERDLSTAYKRVALRCHPDKGGRNDIFETVYECYRVLHAHAERSGMWDAPDVDLSYRAALDARGGAEDRGHGSDAPSGYGHASGSAFNVAEFNRRYDDSRTRNVERDTGYASWMAKAATEYSEPEKPLINPKSSVAAFNSAFEKHTPALDSYTGALILRPMEASAGGLCGALLDDDEEVGDYTTEVGGGVLGADCRLAHANQRLAAPAWAREEVRVDRATVARLGAERKADINSHLDARSDRATKGHPDSADGGKRDGRRGGKRELAAEVGLALSGLRRI